MINSFKMGIIFFSIASGLSLLFFIVIFWPYHQQHVFLKEEKNIASIISYNAVKLPETLRERHAQIETVKKNLHTTLSLRELENNMQLYRLSIIEVHQQHNDIHLKFSTDNPQNFLHFLVKQSQDAHFLLIKSLVIEPKQINLVLGEGEL